MKENAKAAEALLKKMKAKGYEASAKDMRELLDAKGCDSVEDQVEKAWSAIQSAIKEAATGGASYAAINIGASHPHPDVKKAVESKLTKAGFKYEIVGAFGYIYW